MRKNKMMAAAFAVMMSVAMVVPTVVEIGRASCRERV